MKRFLALLVALLLFAYAPMAIATVPTTNYQNSYTADGSNRVFGFDWRLIDPTQMIVQVNGSTVSSSAYTVFQNTDGIGGSVTFTSAPVSSANVVIQRNSDFLQPSSLQNNGAIPPKTLEAMIDKLTIMVQQQARLAVQQILAGANITLSPTNGQGTVTVNATVPVQNVLPGTNVTVSHDGSGNYTVNSSGGSSGGGVNQLFAGSNISLSPSNGLGNVTISSTGGGGGGGGSTPAQLATQLGHTRAAVALLLAGQSASPIHYYKVGDSITANGGNNPDAIPDQIAYRFQGAGINTILNGWRWTAGTDQGNSNYTLGTGWTLAGGFGPRGLAGVKGVAGVATGTLAFTRPATMTGGLQEPNGFGFQLLYTCSSTGASAVIESPSGFPVATLTPTAGTISSYALNGNGSNFVIDAPTGTGDITIIGVCPLPGGNGAAVWDHVPNAFVVSNVGSSGSTSGDWAPTFTSFVNMLAAQTNASTVSIALGKNDMITGVSASTFQTNMQTMITAVKNAGLDCIIVSPNPTNPASYSGIGTVEAAYETAYQTLATNNNILYVDNLGAMVDYATAAANGFMSGADPIHPTVNGYYDEAQREFEQVCQMVGLRGSRRYVDLASGVGGILDGTRIDANIPTTSLAVTGASTNDYLRWNGSQWLPHPIPSGTTPFVSADQTITAGGTLTLAHGLGVTPTSVRYALVCQTTNLGYSVGDVVYGIAQTSVASSSGVNFTADSTNVYVTYGGSSGAFVLLNKSTGGGASITAADWKMRVFAQP